jgi:hypothetical protein
MEVLSLFVSNKISQKELDQNFNNQSSWIKRNSWYKERNFDEFAQKFISTVTDGLIEKFVQMNEYKKVKGLVDSYVKELYNDKLKSLFNQYVKK